MNFLSTQWSTDGSTSSEPMGLCITSIVKTPTDNPTLDDRNHQGHHTTLLLSETLLSTAQASLCVDEVRSLESTPSDMSWCLASSGQHLVDGEGSWGSSSGSRRMVPPPTPQTNHWHGCSSVSLTDWPAAGVTRSGRRIHRTRTPQIFICGDTLRTGCMATTPRLSLTWTQHSSSNKSDPKGGMREGHRELCPPDPNVPAAPGSSFGAHFLSASEMRSFCSTDLKLWRCLLHRLDLM